jgi:multiple sugar transport system substrate-binding protein
MRNRRKIMIIGVTLSFVLLVGATVSFGDLTKISPWFKEKGEPFAGSTITVVTSSGLGFIPALEYAGKRFEKITGIKVKVLAFPWLSFHDKIIADSVAKHSPYDVALIDGWPAPHIYGVGAFEKLKPFLESDLGYPDIDMDDFVQNDIRYNATFPPSETLYGLPYFSDIMMLWYNREYLEKFSLKPPRTWDDYLKIAKALYNRDLDGDGQKEYGIALVAKKCHDISTTWYSRFASFGGELFDENMLPAFNNKIGIETLNLFKKHLTYAAPGSVTFDIPMQDEAFIHGDVAMIEAWTYEPQLADNPERSDIVGKWGVTLMPKGTRYAPCYGGWAIGLPRYAENTKAGFLFIEWATTKEMMKEVALNTNITPARASMLLDPECLRKFPWYKEILSSLRAGIPYPKVPEYDELLDIYNRNVSSAITGGVPVKKALQNMYDEVYKVMDKAGYYKK